uniref:Transcriptional regulator n=1 Tax=Romanomermis culicivorax TaxID=13658 RepID=A0A915INX0_ROMCU
MMPYWYLRSQSEFLVAMAPNWPKKTLASCQDLQCSILTCPMRESLYLFLAKKSARALPANQQAIFILTLEKIGLSGQLKKTNGISLMN